MRTPDFLYPLPIPLTKRATKWTLTGLGVGGGLVGAIIGGPLAWIGAGVSVGAGLLSARLYAPKAPRGASNSVHHGIGDFPNPTDPETPIPVLYGTYRIVPIILQEYVSPITENSGYGIAAVKKQGLSMLCAVAEGQVSEFTDIRINDQPVFSDTLTDNIGKGTGSQKKWVLNNSWAYLPGLTLTVNGTNRANVQSSDTWGPNFLKAPGSELTLERQAGQRILTETIRVYVNSIEQLRDGTATYPWSVRKISRRKCRVVFAKNVGTSYGVKVTYSYLGENDVTIRQDGRGRTTLVFGTAPTNGHAIVATYKRANFPGLVVDTRPGTLDQEPIPGFDDTRNSYTVGQALTKDTDRTYFTDGRKVNDVRVGIIAPGGMVALTQSGDGTKPTFSMIAVAYAPTDASGNLDQGKYRVLYHLGDGESLRDGFQLAGETLSKRTWEISIRDSLESLIAAGHTVLDGFTLEDELALLDAGTAMKVKVTRKDKVNADTSSDYIDNIVLGYATEVSANRFTHPGTALVGLKCMVDDSVAGGSPRLTVTATRADLYDPRTGLWDGRSDNPALAAYDLITSGKGTALGRYGSKGHFTTDDIDTTTWEAWADWCDEYVYNDTSDRSRAASATNGEIRHSCNLVFDTPLSLNEAVNDLARAGRAFVALQGVKWRFPLDNTGSSVFAFVDSTDPANANIVAGSFEEGPDPLEARPTDLDLSYWDEDRDYQSEDVHAQRDDLVETDARVTLSISAKGVTRASEAARLAQYALDRALNDGVTCTWLAHPGAMLPEAGDLVTVTSMVPGGTAAAGWSSQLVRVMAVAREAPGDGRSATVRYVGRILGTKPYATSAAVAPERLPGSTGTGATSSGSSGTVSLSTKNLIVVQGFGAEVIW